MNPDDDLFRSLDRLTVTLPPIRALPPTVVSRGARRRRAKLGALGGSGVVVIVGAVALALSATRGPDTQVRLAGPPPSSTASATPVPQPTSVRSVVLVLEPAGLGYLAGPDSIRHLAFASAERRTVVSVVSQALGEEPTTIPLPDCGATVEIASYKGFSLYFNGSRFVGWSERERLTRMPMTADGLAVGSTLQQLRASLGEVRVSKNTLGVEWSTAGGLAGGLDGSAPGNAVTRIGAGAVCTFR